MHGFTSPEMRIESSNGTFAGRVAKARRWLHARRAFLAFVVLPTLLVTLYYGLIASNQYESEAHFIVRQADAATSSPVLGGVLGLAGGMTGAQSESLSVGDYLSSHDAVAALRRRVDLIALFSRPDVDPLSRLTPSSPTNERLLKFYRKQVDVKWNGDTGIVTLRVRAFRPEDSYRIIGTLLQLGEQRVNALNVRGYESTLAVARRQLAEAESGVARAQSTITRFRQGGRDIDPQNTGQAQTALVSRLRQQLAEGRARLSSMAGAVSAHSPQLVALRRQVQALEAQVGAESGALAGGQGAIASNLGNFEELRLRQEFAAKRYEAAAAALEKARDQAQKQQLFVVRVVEPNLPEKSLYPERLKIILTVFGGLLVAYSIGWLIVAGVKEHAA